MNKEEIIKRYGEDAYEKHLAQGRAYYKAHREQDNASDRRRSKPKATYKSKNQKS